MACSKSIIHRKKSFVQIAIRLQKLLLVYKCGISSTKTAFRLQIFDCQFTKLHFELQSCISECNSAVSVYEMIVTNSYENLYDNCAVNIAKSAEK